MDRDRVLLDFGSGSSEMRGKSYYRLKEKSSLNTTSAEVAPDARWVGYPKIGLNGTLGLLRREKHVGRASALPHAEKPGYPFHPRDGERITGCNLHRERSLTPPHLMGTASAGGVKLPPSRRARDLSE